MDKEQVGSMIPSLQTCYQLIEEMGMLTHIVAHSEQVCRVALCLVDHMRSTAAGLSRPLVHAAALLHDITKTRSFDTGEDHALTGREFLAERGFPEVAGVVGQHVHLDEGARCKTLNEARIVNYADKRVLHDKVVSLEKRMAYILERYGREASHRKRIMALWQESRLLEDRLFRHIDFPPHALTQYIPDD